jgi:hypothetical protein
MAKVHQSHRKVHAHTLVEGLENPFTENRYRATYLADKVVSYSKRRGDQLTRLQKLAVLRFHDEKAYDLRDHIEYTDHKVLNAYIDLFDELFFFGTLTSRCTFTFEYKRKDGKIGAVRTEYRVVRKDIFGLPIKKEKRCKIILYDRLPEENTRYKRLRGYLGTLLHEMIHAFFRLWACDYDECSYTWDGIGNRGSEHGCAWQDVAFALENAVRDEKLLNLDLKLDREAAFALEFFVDDRELVDMDFEWDLEGEEVRSQLDHIRRVGYRRLQK